MAIDRAATYPGRWEPTSTDYPGGEPKNRTTPTSADGTYFERQWLADIVGFLDALIAEGGITRSGVPDTAVLSDHLQGLYAALVANGYLTDSDIGSTVQAHSDDLDDIAALSPSDGDLIRWDAGAGAWVAVRADTFDGLFYKADYDSVVFTKTGAQTLEIKAGTKVWVSGTTVEFSTATAVTMPLLTAGTDYAIWVKDNGTIQADASFTAAPGAGNWRKIGGFHYALSNLNVGSTPNINEYSLWDLKWRPTCADPRGMVLVAGKFWCDIYLLGVNHHTDGTSKSGVTIADGSSPPKVALGFGGDGVTDYGSLTWYEAAEVMSDHGKGLLTYDEFAAAAYGVTETQSIGADQVTTQHNAAYVSKWGVEQATGVMWQWGAMLGGPDSGAAWTGGTEGRGSYYNQPNAVQFGGYWSSASFAGSRSATWNFAPSYSNNNIGARGRCDHLRAEG